MKPRSKIDQIRNELDRLGCTSSDWEVGTDASWTWDGIQLMSRRGHMETIDFEVLLEILRKLPSGLGEVAFWKHIRGLDLAALYDDFNRRAMARFRRAELKWEKESKKTGAKRAGPRGRARPGRPKKG